MKPENANCCFILYLNPRYYSLLNKINFYFIVQYNSGTQNGCINQAITLYHQHLVKLGTSFPETNVKQKSIL